MQRHEQCDIVLGERHALIRRKECVARAGHRHAEAMSGEQIAPRAVVDAGSIANAAIASVAESEVNQTSTATQRS